MSRLQKFLLTESRLEMHPDFTCQVFANWRWSISACKDHVYLQDIVNDFLGDGLTMAESVSAAKNQIIASVTRQTAADFWWEYTKAVAAKDTRSKNGSSPPPSTALLP